MSQDVVFTYNGNPTTLLWANRLPSREALGLWQVGDQAWKVYRTRNVLADLSADYARAAVDAGLPMGRPQFREGKVKQGTAAASDGFVLITEWMTGTNFQKTVASFRSALTRENVPKDRNNTDYRRFVSISSLVPLVSLNDIIVRLAGCRADALPQTKSV